MYFQEPFIDAKLAEYLDEKGLSSPDEIDPDEFVVWIFPALVAHRRPKYEAIAAKYGYTMDARQIDTVSNEAELLELIASVLD